MPNSIRIAITADLHWGIRPTGDEATRQLAAFLRAQPPDALIVAGDIGTTHHFREALDLFADLQCVKALVPGNHDVWVEHNDLRGDSLDVYEQYLPQQCTAAGFHYLDHAPLLLSEELSVAGSINWYDYSWSMAALRMLTDDSEQLVKEKRFSRGRHNDARFVRWRHDDRSFTAAVVATLRRQLEELAASSRHVIVVTHHPPMYGLNVDRPQPPSTIDSLLWDALCGNRSAEQLLVQHQDRIPFVFCGHTHRARENRLGPIRGFNVGSDYHFKRLLVLHWPEGRVETLHFGADAP